MVNAKNYDEIARKMKKILGLKGSPVAVALRKEIPGLEIGNSSRHCEMVQRSRLEGAEFYATGKEHTCKGGAAVIGLTDIPENVANGEFYFKLGAFSSIAASRKTMERVSKLDKKFMASLYAPLEHAKFSPDVVVVIGNPRQAMQIIQAELYANGGRIQADFAGKQSLCADIVANTLRTNSIQVSLGCSGSRKHAKIEDDELIIGIPAEKVEPLVSSLEKLFGS